MKSASASLDLSFLLRHPAHLYALGFGAGLARRAPGTFGTLVAFPIAFALWRWATPLGFLGAIALLGALGVVAAEITGRHLGAADHGAIVCDEVVAFLAVLAYTGSDPLLMAIGFVAFRFFDIAKPFPIGVIDARTRDGFGVMLDDALAAAYTIAVLALVNAWRW